MAYQCFSDNPPSLFDNIDLLARHSDDGVENAKGGELSPSQFDSLSEYVLAVAERTCTTCQLDERRVKILSDRLGLLNVRREKTLEEMGAELEVSRERVRQISSKLESGLFSGNGKAMFAEFVDDVKEIFSRHNWVAKSEALADEVNAVYGWSGTTDFSVRRLLGYCGMEIEHNDSDRDAWMSDGRIGKRYETFLGILNDESVPIESLAQEEVLKNADALGLEGITEDEYMFLVYRAFDKNLRSSGENRSRWSLFLKLRCGMYVGDAAMRRYSVAKALRKAGMRGLTHAEIADACWEADSVVIGEEHLLKADANPLEKFDMDGTGARLLIYDFGDATHERRYSLDVFFKDEELVRVVTEAGVRLRRHMEGNCLGAANITRLVDEINDCVPEPYASEGLPSACVYWLMREQNVGGLRYYDHPNVAHPDILDENGNPPQKALSWVLYKYFQKAGHETATWGQLIDFCEVMLGMDRVIAAATVMPPVMGDKIAVDGESQYRLKAPDETVEPPNVLLEGGNIDAELTFSEPRLPLGMELGDDGKALIFSTYVRLFLIELAKSGYAFTEDEERELDDAAWCGKNLGPNKAVFVRAEPGSTRPSMGYWRVTYHVGNSDYWVNSSWPYKYKGLFDKWARAIAERAGFEFEPYEIQSETTIDEASESNAKEEKKCHDAECMEKALEAFEAGRWEDGLSFAEGADTEDARIQYWMGYCFEHGKVVARNLKEAFRCYKNSAEGGDAKGQFCLAEMFADIAGMWFDREKAFRWYMAAAENGHGEAQYRLGFCYEHGEGVGVDLAEAFRWYTASAEQGESYGQYYLAEMYASGHGVDRNVDKARYWYRKAIEQGNIDAEEGLSFLEGVEEMDNETENVGSPLEAGVMPELAPEEEGASDEDKGIDAEEDEDQLVKQTLDAFENNAWAKGMVYAEKTDKSDSEIQFYMGYCYENGLGTEKDGGEAFRWYGKAVSQGHVKAMLRLAGMYEHGDWVDYNLEEAARLYVCAAIKGDGAARQRIGELAEDEDSIEAVVCQVKDAFENGEWAKVVWIAFLTDMTDARLQYYIGYCCENGLGMSKDLDAAREWYRKSAEHSIFKHDNL